MKSPAKYQLNIRIDKLTNSILNTISGDSFLTVVSEVKKEDLKNISKKNGWKFSWTSELKFAEDKFSNLQS